MGKLIVIDGLDGSGKSTQSDLVAQALRQQGKKVRQISFPDYQQPSSSLVKMYLSGVFSENPDDVNAYAAGSFYAVDRYASYKQFWEKDYREGSLILATRYATSNAIHQMGKLPRSEWENYLKWIEDFEYHKLGLPVPDLVIFLDMNRAVADRLLSQRYQGMSPARIYMRKIWLICSTAGIRRGLLAGIGIGKRWIVMTVVCRCRLNRSPQKFWN